MIRLYVSDPQTYRCYCVIEKARDRVKRLLGKDPDVPGVPLTAVNVPSSPAHHRGLHVDSSTFTSSVALSRRSLLQFQLCLQAGWLLRLAYVLHLLACGTRYRKSTSTSSNGFCFSQHSVPIICVIVTCTFMEPTWRSNVWIVAVSWHGMCTFSVIP